MINLFVPILHIKSVQQPDTHEDLVTLTIDSLHGAMNGKVVLFNDEYHTFEEVITQILKAVHCSVARAEELTWEVHSSGKAMVYEGDFSECLHVSAVLEEIHLRTEIQC